MEFNISNFDYYENTYSTSTKQYVEDIIQITDLDKDSKVFITSALPNNNEVIVFLNSTWKDFLFLKKAIILNLNY